MFESIINFFKNMGKKEQQTAKSKDAAKERLHLVLMQDRANVSADFLDLMKQEIIEVIKKYIDVDENAIDVRLTNKANGDGTTGAPALYANIPIVSIKEEVRNKIARENDEKAKHIIPDKNEKEENKEIVKEDTSKSIQNEEKPNTELKEDIIVDTKPEKDNKDSEIKENDTQVEKNDKTENKKEIQVENKKEDSNEGEACEKQDS